MSPRYEKKPRQIKKVKRARRRHRRRAFLEVLESRHLLAVVSWTGGGDGTTFTDAANWGGAVPGASDDAVIDLAGANPTISFTGTHTVKSLTTNESIQFGTGTFTVVESADINATASLDGGTLSGGTWNITDGSLLFSNSTGNRLNDVQLVGTLEVLGSDFVTLYGSTTFDTARINTNNGNATLAFEPGSTITGDILAEGIGTGAARVGVNGSGTLIIAPDATIQSAVGFVGTLQVSDSNDILINQGSLLAQSVFTPLQIEGTLTNDTGGLMQVVDGASIEVNGTWNTSTGRIEIASDGNLYVDGASSTASFNISPTTIQNDGWIRLRSELDNSASTLLLDQHSGNWVLQGGQITGGTIDYADGSSLFFDNNGNNRLSGVTLLDELRLFSNDYVELYDNTTFDSARITLDAGSSATLAFQPDSTISGDITVDGSSAGANAWIRTDGGGELTIPSGVTIANAESTANNLFLGFDANTTIINQGTILAQSTQQALGIRGQLTNDAGGLLRVTEGASMEIDQAWHASTGRIEIGAGGNLYVDGTATTASFNISPTTIQNQGFIRIRGTVDNANATLLLDQHSGDWGMQGGEITGGILDYDDGSTLLFGDGGGRLNSVALQDELQLFQHDYVRIYGGTTFPSARITVDSGSSATLAFAPGSTISGDIVADGVGVNPSRIVVDGDGELTIAPGVTLSNTSDSKTPFLIGDSKDRIINQGTILARSTESVTGLRIHGEFVNDTGGEVIVLDGSRIEVDADWEPSTGGIEVESGGNLYVGGESSLASFNFSPSTMNNDGWIRLRNTLDLDGGTLLLDQHSGDWLLESTAFEAAHLIGGTLDFQDGRSLYYTSSTSNRLTDVTLLDELQLFHGDYVELYGNTTFPSARISVNANTNGTLAFEAGSSIGNDILVDGAGGNNATIGVDGNGTVTIAPGVTISTTIDTPSRLILGDHPNDVIVNDGTILAQSTVKETLALGILTNNAAVIADQATFTLQYAPTNYSSGTLTNGVWRATNGGEIVFPANNTVVTNNATIQLDGVGSRLQSSTVNALASLTSIGSAGELTLSNGASLALSGALTSSGLLDVQQGTLTTSSLIATAGTVAGAGLIAGATTVGSDASLKPGNDSFGSITTGDLTLQSGSSLVIQVGGIDAGDNHDQVRAPNVTLGGDLVLDAPSLYEISPGDKLVIINNTGTNPISGQFANVSGNVTLNGIVYSVNYSGGDGNDVELMAIASAHVWDGSAGTLDFVTPTNWDAGTVPTAVSDVTIGDLAGTPTIQINNDIIVQSVDSAERINVTAGKTTIIGSSTFNGLDVSGGALKVNVNNSNPAGTTISNAGIVELSSVGGLGAGDITIDDGTITALTSPLTLGNNAVLAGDFHFAGQAAINGSVTLTGLNDIHVNTGGSLSLGGAIGESGGSFRPRKTGDGTLVLGGSNSFTSDLEIAAGTAIVNGSLTTGAVVRDGATLKGAGSIDGTVVAQSGATVAPGNSPGILNVGNFDLQAGATLEMEIGGTTAGTNHDLVRASGTVTLAGELNPFFINGFIAAANQSFTVIDNMGASAISGTFAGLPEGGTVTISSIDFTISYIGGDGNDVVLTAPSGIVTWDGGGTDFDWETPANWDTDTVPGPGDHVVIDLADSDPGIAIFSQVSVRSITLAERLHLVQVFSAFTPSLEVTEGIELGDDAIFGIQGGILRNTEVSGTGIVAITDVSGSAANVTRDGTLDSVTLGVDMVLSNSTVIDIIDGLTLDDATITVNQDGSIRPSSGIDFNGGNQTLAGTGTVVLNNTSPDAGDNAKIAPSRGGTLTIAPGITVESAAGSSATRIGFPSYPTINQGTIISNSGQIDLVSFDNQGTISVDGGTLAVDPTLDNNGTINQTGGEILLDDTYTSVADIGTITGTGGTVRISGQINDPGGTFTINSEQTWLLDGGTLTGIRIADDGDGDDVGVLTVTPNHGTLDGVTLATDMTIPSDRNHTTITVRNDLILDDATVLVANQTTIGNNYSANLAFAGGTLGGTGTLQLHSTRNSTSNFARVHPTSGSLTIGPNIVVENTTDAYQTIIGNPSLPLNLQGTVRAQSSRSALSDAVGMQILGSLVTNTGVIDVDSGRVSIETLDNNGTITADGGDFRLKGTSDAAALGTIAGAGGTISFAGTIDDSGGTITIDSEHTWRIDGGTLKGVTVADDGDGDDVGVLTVTPNHGTLDGVTLATDMTIPSDRNHTTITVRNDLILDDATVLVANQTTIGNNYSANLAFAGGTLGGTGTLQLHSTRNSTSNFARVHPTSGSLTIGPNIVVENTTDAYQTIIGNPSLPLNLQGTVRAQSSRSALSDAVGMQILGSLVTNTGVIDVDSGRVSIETLDNNGTITADGGDFRLKGTSDAAALGTIAGAGGTISFAGTIDDSGGTITIDSEHTWRIDGGTLKGVTVADDGDGDDVGVLTVTPNHGTLDGVTLATDMTIPSDRNHTTITVRNDLILDDATVLVANQTTIGNNYSANLAFAGGTLGGTGTLQLHSTRNSTSNFARVHPTSGSLTIGPNIVVENTTDAYQTIIGNPSLPLNLQGTVRAQSSRSALSDAVGMQILGSLVTNTGVIDVDSGRVSIETLDNNGTITADGGDFRLKGTSDAAALGTIAGAGGTISFAGTIDDSGGTITIDSEHTWRIDGGTLKGVTVADDGDGDDVGVLTVTPNDGTLDGVTLATDMTIASNRNQTTITVLNDLILDDATVLVADESTSGNNYNASLEFAGGTLGGTGTLQLHSTRSSTSNYARVRPTSGSLTIGANVLVENTAGSYRTIIGDASLPLTVLGTIVAQSIRGVSTTDPASSNGLVSVLGLPVSNQGVLKADSGTIFVNHAEVVDDALQGGTFQVKDDAHFVIENQFRRNQATIVFDGSENFWQGDQNLFDVLEVNEVSGSIDIRDDVDTTINRNMTNQGQFTVDSTSSLVAANASVPPPVIAQYQAEGNANDRYGRFNASVSGVTYEPGVGGVGQAFHFDGSNDSVRGSSSDILRPANKFTIDAHIYPTGPGSVAEFGGIIVSKEGEYLLARFSDGSIGWAIANTDPGWAWVDTDYVAPLDQWTRVTFTYENGTATTYANGVQVHQYVGSGAIGDADASRDQFQIGGRQALSQYFDGLIDDVTLFDDSITPTEIDELDFSTFVPTFVQDGGTLDVAAGGQLLNSSSLLEIRAGQFIGNGTVNSSVLHTGGVVSPGNSPGIITVNGNYTLDPGGLLFIETADGDPGVHYDQLQVNGEVTLAGNLEVDIINTITKGSQFTIIDNDGADPVIGTFAGIPEGGVYEGKYDHYSVSYVGGDGNDVVLTALTDVRVVTNTNDSGVNSLRGEMLSANAIADPVAVIFKIPGFGPHTIAPTSALPNITGTTFIDATTQPDFLDTPQVEVSGAGAGNGVDGFFFDTGADGSLITGLAINRFGADGIQILGADEVSIFGNYIGTDPSGSIDLGNLDAGIDIIRSRGTVIGSPDFIHRNIISGNDGRGIDIKQDTYDIIVEGNWVGVGGEGSTAIGNGAEGIMVSNTETNEPTMGHQIGVVGGAPNVVSGNGAGIRVFGADVIDLEIVNNIVGLTAAGDALLANGGSGVLIHGNASGVQIGLAGAGNYIAGAGNTHSSIGVDSGSTDITIQGNFIGVAVGGGSLIGGGVTAASHKGIVLRSSGNQVGGTGFGDGNTIRDMATGGIEAEPGNTILGNSIFNSDDGVFAGDFLGIDIEPDGITTTRLPVIDFGVSGFASTRVGGTLSATPDTDYRIEVFSSSTASVTGYGEGETYLGFIDVTTDAAGDAVWSFSTPVLTNATDFFSATSTSQSEGTSEFSLAFESRDSLIVLNTNDSGANSLRSTIEAANSALGGDLIEFNIPSSPFHLISVFSALPSIQQTVIIDGGSQPDFAGTPVVHLESPIPSLDGLVLDADRIAVEGLSIIGFDGSAIRADSGSNLRIAGNYLGVTGTGVAAGNGVGVTLAPNFSAGVGALIGGPAEADRNVISNNLTAGIEAEVSIPVQPVFVQNNIIGLSPDQNTAMPNGVGIAIGAAGVVVGTDGDGNNDGSEGNIIAGNTGAGIDGGFGAIIAGNLIGLNESDQPFANQDGILAGTAARIGTNGDGVSDALERNVISGNTGDGIRMDEGMQENAVIAGNYIGTNLDATAGIPNGGDGIEINDVRNVTIGGATAAHRNVISGNTGVGVRIVGAYTGSGSSVLGNYIGLGADGSTVIGNGVGIDLQAPNEFTPTNHTIGGIGSQANVIAGNAVEIRENADSRGNTIIGNRVGTNAPGTELRGPLSSSLAIAGQETTLQENLIAVQTFISSEGNFGAGRDGATLLGNRFGIATDDTLLHDTPVTITGQRNTLGDSTVGGRNIFAGDVDVVGGDSNIFVGNYFGLMPDGQTTTGSGRFALSDAAGNQVGGPSVGDGNVFAHVLVAGGNTMTNVFEGNLIGLQADGLQGLDLTGPLVEIRSGAKSNEIGSVVAGNVIATGINGVTRPGQTGVLISGVGTDNNEIINNVIGLASDGTTVIGNDVGVHITAGASGTTIGGPINGDHTNVISGNKLAGISLEGAGATDIENNLIGTDATGQIDRGNTGPGILSTAGSTNINVTRNLISGNDGGGVDLGDGTVAGVVSNHDFDQNNIGVNIDGNAAIPNNLFGVRINGAGQINIDGSATSPNIISGNDGPGILIDGSSQSNGSALVRTNFIGTNANGSAAIPNTFGLSIIDSAPTVSENLISGNSSDGVRITGSGGATVDLNNVIGLAVDGRTALGNQGSGIAVAGAPNVVIGDFFGNVISANHQHGIHVTGSGVLNTTIRGNRIGTDASGQLDRGNRADGIRIEADQVTVSRSAELLLPNVIGGNDQNGVSIIGADEVTVASAFIGVDASETVGIPNAGHGVYVKDSSNVTISGGTDASTGTSMIAFNALSGLKIENSTVTSTGVRYSRNDALAIDRSVVAPTFSDIGVTENDSPDLDAAPNFPILDSALSGSVTQVVGSLATTPSTMVTIEFFANDLADISGNGEGQRLIGSVDLTTDASGAAAFNETFNVETIGGDFITATATTPSGTSEFSDAIQSTTNAPPTIVQDSLLITVVENVDEETSFGVPTLVVDEGQEISLTGDFADVDSAPSVSIFWGDGTITHDPVIRDESFSALKVFADDDPGDSESNQYPILVRVTDADGSGSAFVTLEVRNVSPTITESLLFRVGEQDGIKTTSEGTSIGLLGLFDDPGTEDRHVLNVDWGDGQGNQIYAIDPGEREFGVPYRFLDDGFRVIQYSIFDDDRDPLLPKPGEPGFEYDYFDEVVVLNSTPSVEISVPADAVEGDTIQAVASVTDRGKRDTFTYEWTVWQDGQQVLDATDDLLQFHAVDDGTYTIELTVWDDENAMGSDTAVVTVANDKPQIDPESLDLFFAGASVNSVDEGATFTLRGSFLDTGIDDLHSISVDFGDGTTEVFAADAGQRDFVFNHSYADDPSGNQSNYLLTLTVDDGADQSTQLFPIAVNNVAPELSLFVDRITSSTVQLNATITDPGLPDTHTYEWFVDGTQVPGANLISVPRPSGSNAVEVTVRAIDDDGGVDEKTASLVVLDDKNNTVNIGETAGQLTLSVGGGAATNFPDSDQLIIATLGGNDSVVADPAVSANLAVYAGEGDDTVVTSAGADYVVGGPGADHIQTHDGDDVLVSDQGDDNLDGGDGDDEYQFVRFSDKTLTDSQGVDTLNFSRVVQGSGPVDGIEIDLGIDNGATQNVHSTGTISLNGVFENIVGSKFKDRLSGNTDPNLLFGGPGDDSIEGSGVDDTLLGGEGGDTIIGSTDGSTSIDGGTGDDTIYGSGGLDDTLFGGPGDDSIVGTGDATLLGGEGSDEILAGGDDSIDGGEGDDTIVGSNQDGDTLFGGPGNDTIMGGADDTLIGGVGDDEIMGGGGDESIDGGVGDDTIIGGGSAAGAGDTIFGGPGDDSITGGGDDLLSGGDGADTIVSGTGDESIDGGDGDDSLYGTSGGDTLFGGPGDDTITGNGDDTLIGGVGDDQITGGNTGEESIDGGSGDDTIIGGGSGIDAGDTIFGGPGDDSIVSGGDDTLVGGSGNDIIEGSDTGSDEIQGGVGDDTLVGGGHNSGLGDTIFGGPGDDSITGGGTDTLIGGQGDDQIIGSADGDESIDGGSGDDSIDAGGGGDTIFGGPGNDSIMGAGEDTISGGLGNDQIDASGSILGNDLLEGDEGDDTIYSGSGSGDTIFGGPGDDTITSGGGADTLIGGIGDDDIQGSADEELLEGGDGDDTIRSASGGGDTIDGGHGDDVINGGSFGSNGDTIFGGPGDDSITAGPGKNDEILGEEGDDTLVGAGADDMLNGGEGNDTILGSDDGNTSIIGGGGNDTIKSGSGNGDTVFAGPGNDTIFGGGGADEFSAGDGNDVVFGSTSGGEIIRGDSGDDTLNSGGGAADTLIGGLGDDWLVANGTALRIEGVQVAATDPGSVDRLVFQADADQTLATGATASESTLTSGGVLIANLFDITAASLIGGPSNNLIDARTFTGDVDLEGDAGNDTLLGGSGSDMIVGDLGDDSLNGGAGDDTYLFSGEQNLGIDKIAEDDPTSVDTLDFFGFSAPIELDLTISGEQVLSTSLLSIEFAQPELIENVIGTVFDDTLLGNEADNRLVGGGGSDYLFGDGGDDHLSATRTRWVFLDFDSQTSGTDHVYSTEERNAIEARMKQDFAAFDVQISQTRPTEGVFITALFNAPPIINGVEVSGGVSERIGFRDVSRGGTVQIDTNGFINDGRNGLPDESEVWVALSSTIASHELGHMFGLRHQDAFGAPGTGIFEGVRARPYFPAYEGPFNASATSEHLISSPASVGTTLSDAIANPYFGQREALKLAFGETGASTLEVDSAQKLLPIAGVDGNGVAQDLGPLHPMQVPNTIDDPAAIGYDANANPIPASFHSVLGSIQLATNGKSENDFYAFDAVASDVITIELYSFSIRHRVENTIDSLLRLYDANGNLVDYHSSPLGAFNDDGFEPTDSVLIDLSIPATGRYFVEVDTFHFGIPEFDDYVTGVDAEAFCSPRPNDIRCNDTDTGDYELFIYRFNSSAASVPVGDILIGGEGADTLVTSSGNDTFLADATDSYTGPTTTPETEIINQPPTIQTIAPQSIAINQAIVVNADGADADMHDQIRYSLEPVLGGLFPSGATIDAETGIVSWTPTVAGNYNANVVVSDLHDLTATTELSIVVTGGANSPPTDLSVDVTTINENLAAGTVVGNVAVVDPDVGDSHTLTLVDDAGGRFVLVGNELRVAAGAELDFEDAESHDVRIRATDAASQTLEKTITINLSDLPEATARIGDGSTQRSVIKELVLTFDGVVTVAPDAFLLQKRGATGGDVTTSFLTETDTNGDTRITIRFSGAFTRRPSATFSSLVDGNYELKIFDNKIFRAGVPIDGDGDGTPGGEFSYGSEAVDKFYTLYGDENGTRVVEGLDFLGFRSSFNQKVGDPNYDFTYDYDDDGDVDVRDYLFFRRVFATSLTFE